MSLKQFGKKLLTIHVPSMRHSSKHNSCCIIFRDCFRLNEKEIFQCKSLVIQFYWKLKSIFETSFEIYWSLKIKLSFKLKEIKKGYQNETHLKNKKLIKTKFKINDKRELFVLSNCIFSLISEKIVLHYKGSQTI